MVVQLKKGNSFYGGENSFAPRIKLAVNDVDFVPTVAGRSSQPELVSTFAPTNKLVEIPPDFAREYLITLENLAAYNSDISYALDNIVQFANTEHEIFFSDKIPAKLIAKMKDELLIAEQKWYENSSGMRSLKGDLLAQIVINGALSAEAYPTERLDGIYQVVRVSPKHIIFAYDKSTQKYLPFQENFTGVASTTRLPGYVQLNPVTYKYIALRRFFQTPYATPPFISAIDSLVTQKEMMKNFKNIMQKLGMLGFLSAEVTQPIQTQGESEKEYWDRCVDYLSEHVYPQIQKNLAQGFVAGFKDKHEFKLQGNNMNVQGAEGLFNLIQSRIFAGVKQDPNMLGVNQATTETFGRVILVKMVSQTTEYQSIVDKFIADVYTMHLMLKGYNPGIIKVISKKPMIGDQLKEEQAETAKINNVRTKRDIGIISQEQAANELGYEEPYAEGNITSSVDDNENPTGGTGSETPDGTKTDPANDGNASNMHLRKLEFGLKKHKREFDYANHISCGERITAQNFEKYNSFNGTNLEPYAKRYFDTIWKSYQAMVRTTTAEVVTRLGQLNAGVGLEVVQSEVYAIMLTKFQSDFANKIGDDVNNAITETYEHFRKDKSIFNGKNPAGYAKSKSHFASKELPDGVLDLDDFRAIAYMENSDVLYLGKFITDKDTKNRLWAYLKENYLKGYLPIGKDADTIAQFKKTFSEQMLMEGWKIRRIIDTTMNKVRNYSAVYYMQQVEVEKFEVLEMNDNLTCEYCENMNGLIFEVSNAVSRVQKEVGAGAGNIQYVSPFLTSKPLDEVKGKTASELQAMGFNSPPYHPHCRGTVLAVLD